MLLNSAILLQSSSIILAYFTTRNIFSLLFLANISFLFNFIGSLMSVPLYGTYLSVFYISLGVFLFTLGAFIANKFFKFKLYFKKSCEFVSQQRKVKNVFSYALVLSIMISIFLGALLFINGGIPLLSDNIDTARKLIGVNRGISMRVVTCFLPFLTILSLNCVFINRNKGSFFLFIFIFTISVVFLGFLGYKGSILGFIVLNLMFISIKFKLVNFKKYLIIVFLLIFLGILSVFYITKITFNISNLQVLELLFNRITVQEAKGFNIIVYKFLPSEGMQFGKTITRGASDLLSVLRITNRENSDTRFLGLYLSDWVHSNNNPYRFAYVTTILGDFLINFGIFGLVILSFLFGIFVQYIYILSLKSINSTLLFPIAIYIQWLLYNLIARGGIGGSIGQFFSLLMILIFFVFSYIFLSLPVKKVTFCFLK